MNKKIARVNDEDSIQLSTICRQLKLKASDGKIRLTDCAIALIGDYFYTNI